MVTNIMQIEDKNTSLKEIVDDAIDRIWKIDEGHISPKEFKEYLDAVVQSAFNEGVRWSANKTISKEEAIKYAQYKILIEGIKE